MSDWKPDCVFCLIAHGIIDGHPVAKNDYCLMIADKDPIAPVHMVVLTKDHFDNLSDMQREALAPKDILHVMFALIDDYVRNHNLDNGGYRVVINTGQDAGQTMKHFHMHLIAGAPLKNDFGA